jgi:glycosyltransferase involved in cell wall biosynthesis
MRILNVNASIDPVTGGGTAERTYQLSRFFVRQGAECALLTLNVGITDERLRGLAGVEVTALQSLMPRYHLFPLPEPRIAALVDWADVVHLTGHWTLLNAAVYRAARRAGKPHAVCPAGALPRYGRSRVLKASYNWVVGRKIVRNALACVAVAGNEMAQLAEYGVLPERVTVIPNGIDPEEFATPDPAGFRAKFGLSDAPFILFMGRLNSIKGPDLLLKAFAEAALATRGYSLVFAGSDDGMRDKLKAAVAQAGVSGNVRFIGHVGARDKASAYCASELLVIPSRQEAMSIVVLESGICNRPVLITDRCGFDEVERVGGGRVVPASVNGIRSGLLGMLGDAERLPAMGQRLGDYVRRNFLWEFASRRYLELFSSLLESGRARVALHARLPAER